MRHWLPICFKANWVFQVDSANELTVRDLRLDTGAAVRLFVDVGLSVSDAHLYEDTLEDYFKQVTGGEGIA